MTEDTSNEGTWDREVLFKLSVGIRCTGSRVTSQNILIRQLLFYGLGGLIPVVGLPDSGSKPCETKPAKQTATWIETT